MKPLYHRWLDADLNRWVVQGWVTKEGADNIRSETRPAPVFGQMQNLIGMLGAVLLVFAALTFVASNWQEMSRLLRLVLLFGLMAGAFVAAVWLQKTGRHGLAEACVLLGVGLFGVNIVLIAQMYHLDGRYPDALMAWSGGALVAGFLLWSRAALALSFIAMVIWTGTEILDFNTQFHLDFLLVWDIAAALVWRMNWKSGAYLAALALGLFILFTLIFIGTQDNWGTIGTAVLAAELALAFSALAFLMQQWGGDGKNQGAFDLDSGGGIGATSLGIFLITVFFTQFDGLYALSKLKTELAFSGSAGWTGWSLVALSALGAILLALTITPRFTLWDKLTFAGMGGVTLLLALFKFLNLWVFGAAFLVFALAIAAFGQRRHERGLVNLGLAAFGVEILYIYFELFGSMRQTSLFFLIGGILLIALAFFMTRLRRYFQVRGNKDDEQSGPSSPPPQKTVPSGESA